MAVENGAKHSTDLFKKADGSSMVFFMRPCNERQELRPYIEYGGGKVTSKVLKGSIKLAEKGSLVSSDDYILAKFIQDCVKENKLLAMNQYRVTPGTRVRTPSGGSDNSINSFSSNDSMSPAPYIKEHSARELKGRSKYIKKDDIAMITYLIEENRYTEALGMRVWKDMEMHKVTNHSASSMNTRYRKHILPNIDSYKYDVDRRWLSKLSGGIVVKETEPEFSADALFTVKKKSSRPDTHTTGKKHMTGGFGDAFDFTMSEEKNRTEFDKKSEEVKDKPPSNRDKENTELEIEESDNTKNKEKNKNNGTDLKSKIVKSNKDSKQDHKEHEEPNRDRFNVEDYSKEVSNLDNCDKEKSKVVGNIKKVTNSVRKTRKERKALRKNEESAKISFNNESVVDNIKDNELDTTANSVSDIFESMDDDSELENHVSANDPENDVIEMNDGRLKLSQDASDRNLDDVDYEVAVQEELEGNKDKPDEVDDRITDTATKITGSECNSVVMEVEKNNFQVSDSAETQPPAAVAESPQLNEICSNEVTSSGQCGNENDKEMNGQQERLSDKDDDSFDDMLKSYMKTKKVINWTDIDEDDNYAKTGNDTVVHDITLTESKSQTVKQHNGEYRETRKRKRGSENVEMCSERDEKIRKLVAECEETCQRISDKYDISPGCVRQLLFQCSGDVDRAIAYIEFGPHTPDLPPWTELDDEAMERNARASGLIHKFGLADVINRYNFINYIA